MNTEKVRGVIASDRESPERKAETDFQGGLW